MHAMAQKAKIPTDIGLNKQLDAYLKAHPEVVDYLKRVEKAQQVFQGFVRLMASHVQVRDVPGASTGEADFNAVSRTDR